MKEPKRKKVIFFFILLYALGLNAQFLPKDDAKLNYNQIYFEYPYHKNAKLYNLYLALDTVPEKKDFKSCLFNVFSDATPALKAEGLKFGLNYKWYVETILNTGEKTTSDIHYFSLYNAPYADTSKYKIKQYYNKSTKIQDGLVWCDHLHSALNRKGELVWFIAPLNKDFKEERQIRDFRVYNDGTITFISEPEAYHVTRDLSVIWKGPNDGKISETKEEFYHHTFEKLVNGNYMTLGNDMIELERSDSKDTAYRKVEFANLIEYNSKGEIVWSWRMRDHFMLDLLASENNTVLNPHCNSFSIDKSGKYIYLGFRDISRVIKLDKSNGNIVASYGEKLNKLDTLVIETNLFRKPHDATILDHNTMIILNNNDASKGKISSTEIFALPTEKNKNYKSIWSFKFDFDTLTKGKSMKLGGNKIMTNGNILINEGVINRIVEVSKAKEVLWDLMIYKKDLYANTWSSFPQYNIEFTKSLYPYYFSTGTFRIDNKISLTVFNEGDYPDSYLCNLYNSDGKLLAGTLLDNLRANTQKLILMDCKKDGNYTLRITSMKSGLEKVIDVK